MSTAELLMSLAMAVSTALAATSLWWVSRHFNVRTNPPLSRLAAAIGWLAVGRVAALADSMFFDGPGQPLWTSAFILPTMLAGTWFATSSVRVRSRLSSTPLRYSAAIISTGVVGVIWHTAADREFQFDDASNTRAIIVVAHLVLDFLLLSSVLTLGSLATRLRGLPTRMIALGVVFFVTSDMARIVETNQDTYRFVSWTTVGAFVGPLLVAASTLFVTPDNMRISPNRDVGDTSTITYLPFAVMYILQIVDSRRDPHQAVALFLIAMMVALLIGRIKSFEKASMAINETLADSLDVSERERERGKLITERIIGAAADGIVAIDHHDRVVVCNRAAREILAVPPDGPEPERIHDLFHRDPTCVEPCPVLDELRVPTPNMREVTVHLGDQTRVIEIATRSLDGPESGFVLVFHDVTDRARLAQVKDRIVSVVSHEIRTPLTSIRGSLGLIEGGLMGQVSPEAKRMISMAVESSDRLMRLIDDLLDVERIESGRRALNLESIPINVLLSDVVTTMQPIADSRSVDIEMDAPSDTAIVDRDRIVQVLTNLIQNAIKFSDPGSTIHLSAERDEDHILVTVRDEGHGIPPSHIDAIFEPFHQVDMSDAGPSSGSGLGLAICKEIVEAHGGTIWAERDVERGAVFRFRLPTSASPRRPPRLPIGNER